MLCSTGRLYVRFFLPQLRRPLLSLTQEHHLLLGYKKKSIFFFMGRFVLRRLMFLSRFKIHDILRGCTRNPFTLRVSMCCTQNSIHFTVYTFLEVHQNIRNPCAFFFASLCASSLHELTIDRLHILKLLNLYKIQLGNSILVQWGTL